MVVIAWLSGIHALRTPVISNVVRLCNFYFNCDRFVDELVLRADVLLDTAYLSIF